MDLKYYRRHFWFLISRMMVGVILVIAGTVKATSIHSFMSVMATMKTVPDGAVFFIALLLPPLEILIGLLVLFGSRVGFWVALTLNGSFLLFLVWTGIVLGQHVACGCFGGIVESNTDLLSSLRQVVLVILSGVLIWGKPGPLVDDNVHPSAQS